MTIRRTDDSIHAPSFSKRIRKVPTWAREHPIRLALRLSYCTDT